MSVRAVALQLAMVVLLPAQPAPPEHIFVYVDLNGPGPGSGTAADPFLTIQDAINYVWEHDFILVRPGVYHEVVNLPFFVFLRSTDGPAVTVIDATGLPGTHAVSLDTLCEVTGFTIRNDDGGGVIAAVAGGAQGEPEYGRIIRGNHIRGCPLGALVLSGPCHPAVVENVITGSNGTGVLIQDGASPWFAGNSISGCGVGLQALGLAPDGTAAFANSIIYGNTVEVQGFAPTALQSCIVGDPAFAGVNGNLAADPLFVDPPALDLRLAPGSPAVDAANHQLVPFSSTFDARGYGALRRMDGDGDGMVQADIGAFERGGLQARQMGSGAGSQLVLEIATPPGTWLLGTGILSSYPLNFPGVQGYLFLDVPTLLLALNGPQGLAGATTLTFPIADPGLVGLGFFLQAAGLPASGAAPVFTNLELVQIR